MKNSKKETSKKKNYSIIIEDDIDDAIRKSSEVYSPNLLSTKKSYYFRNLSKINSKTKISNYRYIDEVSYNMFRPDRVANNYNSLVKVNEFIENENYKFKSFKDVFNEYISKDKNLKDILNNPNDWYIYKYVKLNCGCYYDCSCTSDDKTSVIFFKVQEETDDEMQDRLLFLATEKEQIEKEKKSEEEEEERKLFEKLSKKYGNNGCKYEK